MNRVSVLMFFTLSVLTSPSFASQIVCNDEQGLIKITAELPGILTTNNVNASALMTAHISSAVSGTNSDLNVSGQGGVQWDNQEGGLAGRFLNGKYLVSVRTSGFNENGLAFGRFEDVGNPRLIKAICQFIK